MAPEQLGPLFIHPQETHYLWLVVMLFSLATIGLALVALVRGSLPVALASPGLLLLPLFAYVLGDLFLLEESKREEFCGSCHETMGPVVEAMHDDEASLAALHFRRGAVPHHDACYVCHSGYGIWGTAQAKRAGLVHMIHTVTGNYEFPLQHAGRFDIDACLACHAEALPFRAVEAHRDPDIQNALLNRELGCTGACHPTAHPPEALMGASVP